MFSTERPDAPERVLLAAGTWSYASTAYEALHQVPGVLRKVVETLRDLGFTAAVEAPGYMVDPKIKSFRANARRAAEAAPIVVVYYTGHGAHPDRDTYYLVSQKSQPADLGATSLPARELLTLLLRRNEWGETLPDDQQPKVLIILDCCFSGSAGMEMLGEALHGIGNPSTWVIASAGALEYAQQGIFAVAFCDALQRPTIGPSQKYVSLDTIVQAVNDAHAGQGSQQARLFLPAAGSTGIPPFFPNPGHAPHLAGLTVADQQHWLSRAQAGPEESTIGFYLTGKVGRVLAAEHLAKWITNSEEKGLAVVTGSPGSGKSTLLALPVLLTQPPRRRDLLRYTPNGSLIQRAADLLPADTPVIAIHARGLNTDQVSSEIARALGRQANSASGLLEGLDTAPQLHRRVVIVDAIDEAASPTALLGSLLVPLAHHAGIKVVLGTRRHVLSAVGETDLTIDLDTSSYRDPQALADYAHQLLIAAHEPSISTPYQSEDATVRSDSFYIGEVVAEAIAKRATGRAAAPESFLIARLLALSVRNRSEPVDITSPDWQAELPASVADAFDEDLDRLGDNASLARIVLGALAWAKGPGLPWENIWAPVARAIEKNVEGEARPQVTDEDIRWVLSAAGAFIVEDLGPGDRSVYRPFHDMLAAHLRGESAVDGTDVDPADGDVRQQYQVRTEQAITHALLATVPTGDRNLRDWLSAHPYIRTYLAQHAAAAEPSAFPVLVSDLNFLAAANPVTLTPLLSPTMTEVRTVARIYRRARPLLHEDPHANAAYLQEAARALTGSPASPHAGLRPVYRTRFASLRRDDSLLAFTGHTGSVRSVAFGTTMDGQILLASASDDRTLRLWDPATGAHIGEPLVGHTGAVSSVAFGTDTDGRLLLASAGDDRTVRLWDPATGRQVGKPLSRPHRPGHIGGIRGGPERTAAAGVGRR